MEPITPITQTTLITIITLGRLIMAATFILLIATFAYGSPQLKLYWDRFRSWWIVGWHLLRRDHRSMSEAETNLVSNWAAAHGIALGLLIALVFFALE